MAKHRVVKVTGYLVFKESDVGYNWSKEEIVRSLSGIHDLTVTEVPDAVKTKQGIRTDQ